jgi:hypothetical protein
VAWEVHRAVRVLAELLLLSLPRQEDRADDVLELARLFAEAQQRAACGTRHLHDVVAAILREFDVFPAVDSVLCRQEKKLAGEEKEEEGRLVIMPRARVRPRSEGACADPPAVCNPDSWDTTDSIPDSIV